MAGCACTATALRVLWPAVRGAYRHCSARAMSGSAMAVTALRVLWPAVRACCYSSARAMAGCACMLHHPFHCWARKDAHHRFTVGLEGRPACCAYRPSVPGCCTDIPPWCIYRLPGTSCRPTVLTSTPAQLAGMSRHRASTDGYRTVSYACTTYRHTDATLSATFSPFSPSLVWCSGMFFTVLPEGGLGVTEGARTVLSSVEQFCTFRPVGRFLGDTFIKKVKNNPGIDPRGRKNKVRTPLNPPFFLPKVLKPSFLLFSDDFRKKVKKVPFCSFLLKTPLNRQGNRATFCTFPSRK